MPRHFSTWKRPRPLRRGTTSAGLLLALPVMFSVIGLALFIAQAVLTQTSLRGSVDAAALSGSQAFVSDRRLLDNPTIIRDELIPAARQFAQDFAALNPVQGAPLALDPNTDNDPFGDITFAILADPTTRQLDLADLTVDADVLAINVMRIRGRRTRASGLPAIAIGGGPFLSNSEMNTAVFVTSYLDGDVIGFRPQGQRNLRMVPIALLSDPTGAPPNPESWERQVEQMTGGDNFRFDTTLQQFVNGNDGLHEMTVTIGGGSANSRMLQIPTGSDFMTTLVSQVCTGISRADLTPDYGGQFVLGLANQLTVPTHPTIGDETGLLACLTQLWMNATRSVWPLYSSTTGMGDAVLTGFVAARVIERPIDNMNGTFTVRLQPTRVIRNTAVTDFTRRGVGVTALPNRYIVKIRLVE